MKPVIFIGNNRLLNKFPYKKIKGDIIVTQISNKQVKAEFVKEVTTKKGTKEYPSYLVFENVNGEWKLILESDLISDKNVENREKDFKAVLEGTKGMIKFIRARI